MPSLDIEAERITKEVEVKLRKPIYRPSCKMIQKENTSRWLLGIPYIRTAYRPHMYKGQVIYIYEYQSESSAGKEEEGNVASISIGTGEEDVYPEAALLAEDLGGAINLKAEEENFVAWTSPDAHGRICT